MNRSIRLILIASFVMVVPSAVLAQVQPNNHKPVFLGRGPSFSGPHYPNVPYYFWVSAYDPDGDTLTYSWRLDLAIVQSGRDSAFTMIFSDPSRTPQRLTCVFSDPGGLKDSTTWAFGYLEVPYQQASPGRFVLHKNYPNPFNPMTTISFDIPATEVVKLRIFNSLGQAVATLVEGRRNAGSYRVVWKTDVSSGVYYYLLEAGSYYEVRSMLLIK
jgi:hypothetical protein